MTDDRDSKRRERRFGRGIVRRLPILLLILALGVGGTIVTVASPARAAGDQSAGQSAQPPPEDSYGWLRTIKDATVRKTVETWVRAREAAHGKLNDSDRGKVLLCALRCGGKLALQKVFRPKVSPDDLYTFARCMADCMNGKLAKNPTARSVGQAARKAEQKVREVEARVKDGKTRVKAAERAVADAATSEDKRAAKKDLKAAKKQLGRDQRLLGPAKETAKTLRSHATAYASMEKIDQQEKSKARKDARTGKITPPTTDPDEGDDGDAGAARRPPKDPKTPPSGTGTPRGTTQDPKEVAPTGTGTTRGGPKAPTIGGRTTTVRPTTKIPRVGRGGGVGSQLAPIYADLVDQEYTEYLDDEHRKLLDQARNDPALRQRIIDDYNDISNDGPIDTLVRGFDGSKGFTQGATRDIGPALIDYDKMLDSTNRIAAKSNSDPLYQKARIDCGGYDTCVVDRTRKLREQNAKDIANSTKKAQQSANDPLYQQAQRDCGGYDTCVRDRVKKLRKAEQQTKNRDAKTTNPKQPTKIDTKKMAAKSNADPLYQKARIDCGGYDTCVTDRTRKLREQNAKDIANSTKKAQQSANDPLYQQAQRDCGGYDTCVQDRVKKLRKAEQQTKNRDAKTTNPKQPTKIDTKKKPAAANASTDVQEQKGTKTASTKTSKTSKTSTPKKADGGSKSSTKISGAEAAVKKAHDKKVAEMKA